MCIPASAVVVNPNEIKILLANVLIKFFINGNPVFNNGSRSLPRSHPDCIILKNWVFDSLILTDELFAKVYEDWQLVY